MRRVLPLAVAVLTALTPCAHAAGTLTPVPLGEEVRSAAGPAFAGDRAAMAFPYRGTVEVWGVGRGGPMVLGRMSAAGQATSVAASGRSWAV
ncbi:MAG: hypothetical protein M3340_11000, partial [Actinomycetota bacterium]|nr:hypothetical protein [Actinomycetota bacterium]